MDHHHNSFFGYLIAAGSALVGGYVPSPVKDVLLSGNINAVAPDFAAFGVQLLQAAAFAFVGTAVKYYFEKSLKRKNGKEREGEE